MKNLYLILPVILLSFNGLIHGQDSSEEVEELSTVEALLALVKEGKTNSSWNKFAASSPKTVSCDD